MTTEHKIYEIAEEVGNWYGTFYDDANGIYIDDGYIAHTYDTPKELLQDWIYTMLEDENNVWNAELKFLLSNGIKVTGIRTVKGKRDTTFMACVDYLTDKGKTTRNISVGTYKLVKEAFIARTAVVELRKECLAGKKTLEEFKESINILKGKLKNEQTMKELCYSPFHS